MGKAIKIIINFKSNYKGISFQKKCTQYDQTQVENCLFNVNLSVYFVRYISNTNFNLADSEFALKRAR
jgi:hypothetical protein